MRAIITADIHNGVPGHVDDCIWSMRVIREYAHQNDINVVLVLGDLFHDRFSLDIEVLTKVYNFFDDTDKNYDQNWICFPGNHDMFFKNSWTTNSLRPLDRLLTIYEDISLIKIESHRFWILPFVHFENAYMEILSKIEKKHEKDDVLLTHIGINGATLNECFLLKNWSVVNFEDSKFDRVYTGHFHCTQQVKDNVWYPGSPIPFRFDEGVVEHGFFVYDMEERTHEFIPIFEFGLEVTGTKPPDYITLTPEDISTQEDLEGNNVRIMLDREYSKNEIQEMHSSLKGKGTKNVRLSKYKEEGIDIKKMQLEGSDMSSDNIFVSWLEIDKPDLNKELLVKINDQVSQTAKELIVVEDVEDD